MLSMTVVEALKGVLGGLRETFAAAGTERDGSYDGMYYDADVNETGKD